MIDLSKFTSNGLESTLGPKIKFINELWVLDLSKLKVLHGLSILAKNVAGQLQGLAKSSNDIFELTILVTSNNNPEMVENLNVAELVLAGDINLLKDDIANQLLTDYLRTLLGAIQRENVRDYLFDQTKKYKIIYLFSKASDKPIISLECTFSSNFPDKNKLILQFYPKDLVQNFISVDMEERAYIAGSTRIAQTWRDALLSEIKRNGRQSFVDALEKDSHTWNQFKKSGLDYFSSINVCWLKKDEEFIVEKGSHKIDISLKKALLALEDPSIRDILHQNKTVCIQTEAYPCFIDLSHRGTVLNISLAHERKVTNIKDFNRYLPRTFKRVWENKTKPLKNKSIFLVHHNTREILAWISALRELGCMHISVLFVQYGAKTPWHYLEALHALPQDEFSCASLQYKMSGSNIAGFYQVNPFYSLKRGGENIINLKMKNEKLSFFDAMKVYGLQCFSSFLKKVKDKDNELILVEDGGYLAPILNQKNFEKFDDSLSECLDKLWIGSVEHTKNGLDKLCAVEAKYSQLKKPAITIAVTEIKREIESEEVAITIINAIENYFIATGKVLSSKSALVLGARGAIGSFLMKHLRFRLHEDESKLFGIDIRLEGNQDYNIKLNWKEFSKNALSKINIIIGVVGKNTLTREYLESWLINGTSKELAVASGSTKTLEFTEFLDWMKPLSNNGVLSLEESKYRVLTEEIRDPQTGKKFGEQYSFINEKNNFHKTIIFLSNLMPVNFMYYGVPAETIDLVLDQLLGATLQIADKKIRNRLRNAVNFYEEIND